MKFQPQTHILKSGTTIQLRIGTLDDAQSLLDLKRGYLKNSSTIPLTLEEYPNDPLKEKNLISEYLMSPNSILLLAEFNDKLIGNIDLTGNKRSKMFHTGMIGMGIAEEWRNQGLGKVMIHAVIEWAKEHSQLEILWLDVYSSNEIGYQLYQNTGFKVSGIIKDYFKEYNGYKDKIQMYQNIRVNIG